MNLGLLLLKKSGKQGSLKFIITLIASALGTLILLFVFSITNAVNTSNDRSIWKSAVINVGSNTEKQLSISEINKPDSVIYVQPINGGGMSFLGESIYEYDMYFPGGKLPKNSPLDTYPKSGEYYASPALSALIKKYPNEILGDRFQGKEAGIIPERSLSSPDELIIIKGIDESKFTDPSSHESMNAMRIDDFSVSAFGTDYQKMTNLMITVSMSMGAIGLIIPVMMLITTATALGARERETRYAALRLIGATKRQIRSITLVDSLAASIAGIMAGAATYTILRPILFSVRVSGRRFFQQDISVSFIVFGAIIIAIIGIVWIANRLAMRKVITSPLGIARKQKLVKPPHFWSIIPLLLSLAGFAYFGSANKDILYKQFGDMFIFYILGLFVISILGLLLAGGWLTKIYGRSIAIFNRNASGVLVSRRISHEARRIFRGIGGIVIAFYTGAFFITSFATVSNLVDLSASSVQKVSPDHSISFTDIEDSANVAQIHKSILENNSYQSEPIKIYSEEDRYIISCKDVKRLFNQQCANDSKYITIPAFSSETKLDLNKTIDSKPVSTSTEDQVYVNYIYIPKLSSTFDKINAEKIITTNTKNSGNVNMYVINRAYREESINGIIKSFKDLLYAGIILTIIVASLNLVVATMAGLFDRKNSFLTLHLGGAEMPFLKKIIIKESMFPLVFISLISIACGFYVAYVFLKIVSSTLEKTFVLPELFFWECVIAVFVLSYFGIKLILPMLNKLTDVNLNRTE